MQEKKEIETGEWQSFSYWGYIYGEMEKNQGGEFTYKPETYSPALEICGYTGAKEAVKKPDKEASCIVRADWEVTPVKKNMTFLFQGYYLAELHVVLLDE